MQELRLLTARQWTPFREDLLARTKELVGATRAVRKGNGEISLRGGKLLVNYHLENRVMTIENRERGNEKSKRMTMSELKELEVILNVWASSNLERIKEVANID